MEERKKIKIVTNGIWSIFALILYQSVMQFFVYPSINRHLGVEEFGNILYIVALLSILAPAVGNAVGNIRVITEKENKYQNGDFLLSLGLQSGITATVFLLLCQKNIEKNSRMFLLVLIFILTAFRYYGESTYKISLNFKNYFYYYFFLSFGYFLGIYFLANCYDWLYIFLFGELICSAILILKEKIFWPYEGHKKWKEINKQSFALTLAYLFSYTVAFLDRILLQHWADGTSVSIYYVSSLLGKMVMLLVDPLNNVILSYLAKLKTKMTYQFFLLITGVMVSCGGILYVVLLLVSPIFIQILYPRLYEATTAIIWLVTLSQIFYAVASMLMTVLLRICGVKWQLAFQLFYFSQSIFFYFIGLKVGAIKGFAVGGTIANIIQLILVFILGLVLIRKHVNWQEADKWKS